MSVLAALQSLAATGAFASRAFLPLFLVGAVARWPQLLSWIPFVPDRPIVLSERLDWLQSPWCLAILGTLALLEALAERDPDARQVLQEIDAPVKGVVAFVTAFALVDGESAALLRHVASIPVVGAGPSITDPGTLLAVAFALGIGVLTFVLAWWRASVFRDARDVADDFGLGRIVAWIEEAWSAGSMLLAIAAPVLAVIVALAGLAALRGLQWALERAEESGRRPCAACGSAALPMASACLACGASLEVLATGAGAAWPDRWLSEGDPRGIELLSRGRCPACAERRDAGDLAGRAPHACGWPARGGAEDVSPERLLENVRSRVAPLALVAGLLGILPVAGSVAAIVLARARIAAPLRRFLPAGARLRARWTWRLAAVPLLLFSGVPVLSAACAASLVVIAGVVWTGAFEREVLRRSAALQPERPPAA